MRCTVATLALAGLLSAGGCDVLNPYSEEERVVEVTYGPLEDLQRSTLRTLRADGWDCNRDGEIRNAFGNAIGTRYRCARCR